jgi:hypothetical protein
MAQDMASATGRGRRKKPPPQIEVPDVDPGSSVGEPQNENGHGDSTTHAELDSLIGKFSGMKTMLIDAAAAQRLLATNTGNRRINARRVANFARQMKSGHFENTGEPIIISSEGILNDGQHRLLSVIEAGVSIEMDIRFGIPRKAFVKTDTGAARGAADVLSIRQIPNAAQLATTIRLLLAYERGLPEHLRDPITNDEINRGFDRWPDIVDAASKIHVNRFPPQIRSTPLYATTFLAMRAPKAQMIDEWLNILATGLDTQRENPAYQLREKLVRGVGAELDSRERQLLRFALMIKSWNLFRSSETVPMREFRWSAVGRDPESFPKVTGARLGHEDSTPANQAKSKQPN